MLALKKIAPLVIVFFVSTAFSFAVSQHQMNYILIIVMLLIIPLYLFQFHSFNTNSDLLLIFFWISITISALYHKSSFRASTLFYTLLFLITFIYYYKSLYNRNFNLSDYKRILRIIIIAYFIVIVIQQICVILKFPFIINYIAGDVEILKLNSLGPEPSHSARFVLIAFLSYIFVKNIESDNKQSLISHFKQDFFIWFAFLYTMLTMGSGFAILLLFIFLIRFFKLKQNFKTLLYLLPIALIVILFISYSQLEPVVRVKSFAEALLTLDSSVLMKADHSASVRVVPILLYFQKFDISNINTWIGHGTDFTLGFLPPLMLGVPEGSLIGGFFPAFFFDRGLIPAIILFIFFKKFCLTKVVSWDTLIFGLSIFEVGVNTQLFWFIVITYTTNKYFYLIHSHYFKKNFETNSSAAFAN